MKLVSLPHTDRRIRSLALRCKRWGGELLRISQDEFEELRRSVAHFAPAPFSRHNMAISWKSKKIFYVAPDTNYIGLIHEIAHVFACEWAPHSPWCDEFDFLGWELALAKCVGDTKLIDWFKDNTGYYIAEDLDYTEASEVGLLTPKERKLLIKDRLYAARYDGLINTRNTPLSVRKSV